MKLRDLYEKLDSGERSRLAQRAGISTVYLWQLQKGVRKNPSLDLITRLAAADKRLKVAELVEEFSEAKDEPRQAIEIVTPTYTGTDRRKTATDKKAA